jgi:dienelactone hydrolase
VGGAAGSGGSVAGCCADCICRGDDPAESSAANGPYQVANFTVPAGTLFGGGTVYYPTNADPPFAGLILCPGWTATQNSAGSVGPWGPFLASWGIVTVTIDTVTTGDVVTQRDDALLQALEVLKAENSKAGSPLNGKMSDRYGLGGWSMGGGGTWLATAAHPELKSGMTFAGHNATAGGGTIASGITVPSILFCGALDNAILGGGGQSQAAYAAIPETTPKILYEFADLDHFGFGNPGASNGNLGKYGLAFQKTFLEGDTRWKKFLLVEGPGASDWQSTVQ